MTEYKLSFWETLMRQVHVNKTMTMLEAHKRDSLYGWCKNALWGEIAARKYAENCPAGELPDVIFVRDTDQEAEQLHSDIVDLVAFQKLHPRKAAQQYYDLLVSSGQR